MLGGIFGTVVGKVLAGILGVAGLAGGLAAAGALPGVGGAPEVEVAVDTPAAKVAVPAKIDTVTLDSLPAGTAAAEAVGLINEAEAAAAKAAAAAQKCVDTAGSQLNALLGTLKGVTDLTQVQGLLGTATSIGNKAQTCANEAKALSQSAVDKATAAASQAGGLGGLSDLGGLSGAGNPNELIEQIIVTATGVVQSALDAQGMANGIVDQVIATVGSLLPVGGLPLPVPGGGGGGLPLPLPGSGEGGLPVIGDLPGLPLPGGEGGLPLPLPGTGEGGLPVPGLDGLGDVTGIVTDLANSILGGLGGTLPVPAL